MTSSRPLPVCAAVPWSVATWSTDGPPLSQLLTSVVGRYHQCRPAGGAKAHGHQLGQRHTRRAGAHRLCCAQHTCPRLAACWVLRTCWFGQATHAALSTRLGAETACSVLHSMHAKCARGKLCKTPKCADALYLQAVSTTLHLSIDSITGLPRSVIAAEAAGSRGAAGASAGSKVALLLVDTTTQ